MALGATWMQLEVITLREVRKRKTNIICHLDMESKIRCKWTYLRNRNRHREQTCSCQGGRRWGGVDWEFGISRCQLLYTEWVNKALLHSTENYSSIFCDKQYSVINHDGKEYENECMSVHNRITLLYSKNPHIINQLCFNKHFFIFCSFKTRVMLPQCIKENGRILNKDQHDEAKNSR